jgi:hypothetical protein
MSCLVLSLGAAESVCFGGLYGPRSLLFIVSISARFFMDLALETFKEEQIKEYEATGSILWSPNVRGERKTIRVTKQMIDEFETEQPEQCKLS